MTTLTHKMRLMAGVAAVLAVGTSSALSQDATAEPAGSAQIVVDAPQESGIATVSEAGFDAESGGAAVDQATDIAPVWTTPDGGPSAAAEALIAAMADAPRHALPAKRYGADALSLAAMGLGPASSAEERAEFEAAMTEALVLWGGDMKAGLLKPYEIDKNIKHHPARPGADALLSGLAGASDPAAWIAELAPEGAEYAALQEGLVQMQAVIASGAWGPSVPAGPTLRPGDRSDRVEALRNRLAAMGDVPVTIAASDGDEMAVADTANDSGLSEPLGDPRLFDEGLVNAVKTFQARHGLNTDGVVGPATLAALNISAEERLGRIAVNMERLRWMNRDLGERRVMVNIAGFTMELIDGDEVIFESRVVVGKPKHQTPEFSDEMEHMVVNPSWNVPYSIASKEILPKLRRDPGYLAKNNMELIGAEPWFIDWHAVSPSNFPGRIKQRPGSGNALGTVKFMFPNDNAIYLHDTPSRSLFAKDLRAYSHGCVRVEKPREFAAILLAAQSSNPEGTFESLLRSGRERWVNLEEHIPVHLGYRTAWIDKDGTEQFRSDIYGRDAKVLAAMQAAGVSLGL